VSKEPFVLPPAPMAKSPHAQYLLASKEDQDAAKRISEQYQLHIQAAGANGTDVFGWCFPVSIADGTPGTGGVYPNKAAAAHAMGSRSRDYIYPFLGPHSFPPWDAYQFLLFFRRAKAEGWAIADPDYVRSHNPKLR